MIMYWNLLISIANNTDLNDSIRAEAQSLLNRCYKTDYTAQTGMLLREVETFLSTHIPNFSKNEA